MNNWCICFFTHILTKCTVLEAKFAVKNSSGSVARRDLIPALKGLIITTIILAFRMTVCLAFILHVQVSLPRVEHFAAPLSDVREMHLCQSLTLNNVHAVDIRGTSKWEGIAYHIWTHTSPYMQHPYEFP
jgi:hypothetical protein